MLWLWLVAGFMTSAVTLHIATLLLLDNPSFAKAVAVAGSVWFLGVLFVAAHVGGELFFSFSSLVLGCVVLKRLYGIGAVQALLIVFLHGIVEIAIAVVIWFAFPSLLARQVRHQRPVHAAAGSGCPPARARV
ncbi:MAG TPA: hypothetical protein VI456_11930 [Polyangia bacterium]